MNVTLLAHTPHPLEVTEQAASICYNTDPAKTGGKLTRGCYLSGHHTVLEHVSFTFKIEGVSRALLAQLTRHRLASFDVQSQRYVDQKNALMVVPPRVANDENAMNQFYHSIKACAESYQNLQDEGISNEDARFVLPNACTTELITTMNLREFIHFCNLRLCVRAQWEIRSLCKRMVAAVNEATDNVFAYMLVPSCERIPNYPVCPENKKQSCGKHPRLQELYDWYDMMHTKKRSK